MGFTGTVYVKLCRISGLGCVETSTHELSFTGGSPQGAATFTRAFTAGEWYLETTHDRTVRWLPGIGHCLRVPPYTCIGVPGMSVAVHEGSGTYEVVLVAP